MIRILMLMTGKGVERYWCWQERLQRELEAQQASIEAQLSAVTHQQVCFTHLPNLLFTPAIHLPILLIFAFLIFPASMLDL